MTERELTPDDHRVTCAACAHFEKRHWRCVNARMAQLQTRHGITAADVGPEFSQLPQDCPGYAQKAQK